MPIDPVYRQRVLADARTLVRDGVLEVGFEGLIAEAQAGDDDAFDQIDRALSAYYGVPDEEGRRSDWLNEAQREVRAARFGAAPPPVAGSEAATAMSRARTFPLDQLTTLEEFEAEVFRDIEGARWSAVADDPGAATIEERVRQVLIGRIAEGLTTRPDRHRAPIIPPAPGTPDFAAFLQQRFDIDAEQARSWEMMSIWVPVLVLTFHLLMGQNIIADRPGRTAENRLSMIDRRRQWFEVLVSARFGGDALTGIFTDIDEPRADPEITALAELRRFVPSVFLEDFQRHRSRQLLVRDIEDLHRAHPELGAESFFRILTPFVDVMDREGISTALSEANPRVDPFLLFRTKTILAWHAAPPEELRDWLQRLVERNVRYRSLQKFCNVMFAATPNALTEKLIAMRDAGVDMRPLVRAIRQKFPQAHFRLPGGGRPKKQPPPAPPKPDPPPMPPPPQAPAPQTPPSQAPPPPAGGAQAGTSSSRQLSFSGFTIVDEAPAGVPAGGAAQTADPDPEPAPNPLDPTMPSGEPVQLLLPFVNPGGTVVR